MPQLLPSHVAVPAGSPGQALQLAPQDAGELSDRQAPPQA
jgi:hypothetical protein